MDFKERFEVNKELITDRLQPDFGLLDKLLASRSLTRPEVADVKAVSHSYGRSGKLLEYVFDRSIYVGFLDALRVTEQTHLVNFILSNGDRRPEFGDDWPLTEQEISILDTNQYSLVDLLDTYDLLPHLYSQKVVNNRQSEFVSTRTTSHKNNEALLEILRRSNLRNYNKTIDCLHSSKQGHIAKILEEGGGVVRVRSHFETESYVKEVESEIITKFTEMLGDRSLGDAARILECTQLRLIAVKQGNGIILYFFCTTSAAELINLQEMQSSGKLVNVVREMFNKMLSRPQVLNLRTTVYDDFSKCEMAFRPTETTTQFENCAIVVGLDDGKTMTEDVIKINLCRPREISTRGQIPTTMKMEAFAAVYCNTMYVIGVGAKYDEIWKFNLVSGWTKCASLVQGRRRHSAAFIDEVLYICGGFVDSSKKVLNTVEAYNAITDKCAAVGKLVHSVKNPGNCVPFKSSLYIFGGGVKKKSKAVNYVQVYNTKENACTLFSKPMPGANNLMRAALWETSVILLGHHTCFIFNIETETWRERKQFKTDVVHFGLVLVKGRVFVIGGGTWETDKVGKTTWKCRDDVRYVPLQNILDDKPIEWKIRGNLPKPSVVYACSNLSFLPSK